MAAFFLGVELPLLLQFSIALFTGMVAATLVPPVRRSIPRPIEVVLWVALVAACVIGVLSITSPKAREVTMSAIWGVDQVIGTLIGLVGVGILAWIIEHRFAIATGVVFLCGADILALAMLRTYRQAQAWWPQVRLGEWMEVPRRLTATPQPVLVPYAIDELNRKWAAAFAFAGAALLAGLVNIAIWARNVLLPRHAERPRARLESLRDTASQLGFAARSWYAAAGAPAVNGLAAKAARLEPSRVADIRIVLGAQSMGWSGSARPAAAVAVEEEEDKSASGHTDRLAS